MKGARFGLHQVVVGTLRYGLLLGCVIIIGYPVLWMVLQSFKSAAEMYANMWGMPQVILLGNYARAVEMGMVRYILNSTVVAVGTVLCILMGASLAAYALSKFAFVGNRVLLFVFIPTLRWWYRCR
jgi:raffinose/stachyose/melibiose transport system permease protein